MHAVHPPGYKDPHSPLPPSFCQESSLELSSLLAQTQAMGVGNRTEVHPLALSDETLHHSARGHRFQYMVATCRAQHLCNEKGKDNLKDPGPTLWLPGHPVVHIFTTTAIEADKIKQIETYGRHLVNSQIHMSLFLFSISP